MVGDATYNAPNGVSQLGGNIRTSSGTAGLTKTGIGTLLLSGTNTYNGATTISSGMLQFSNQVSLYNNTPASWTAANIVVANTGTLALNVGGAGQFTTSNVTTLLTNLGAVNGTSTTGFAAGSSIGFDTTNASGGTFTVADNIANSSGTGGGAIGVVKLGSNTLVLSGTTNSYAGATSILGGTLSLTGSLTGGTAITISSNANGTGTVIQGVLNQSAASVISGASSITQSSTGFSTLSGTNTYTAGTNINAGTVQFTKLVSMPATGTVAVSAATLAVSLGGTGEWTTGTSGNGTIGGLIAASAVGGQGNTVTWAGASAVGFDTTNAGSTQTYSGNIVNRGTTLGVTKLGTGTLELSGTNSYTGTTTVSGGTLIASGGAAIANAGLVTLANVAGATFQLNSSETIGNLSGGGTTGGTVALGGNTLTVGDTTSPTYAGNFTGTSGSNIIKQGSGTLTLAATSIPGTATINAGMLAFSTTTALSGGTITLGANTSGLLFNGAGAKGVSGLGGAIISNNIVLGNSVTTTGARLWASQNAGSWNFTGNITGASGAAGAQTVLFDSRAGGATGGDRTTTTISGVIAEGKQALNLNFAITPQTGSTAANNHPTYVNLTGLNTFTGSITATRAVAGATSWLVIGGERWSDGPSNTPTYGRMGSGYLGANNSGNYTAAINFGNTAGNIVNLGYFSSANQTWSGVIGGGANNNGAIVKEGTGTLTLTAANGYNRLTTIGGGTLALAFNTGVTTSNILPSGTPLWMGLGTSYNSDSTVANAAMTISGGGGGGTLVLGGNAASANQTVASLNTAVNTASSIVLGANRTLTITSPTITIGTNSGLNFNTALGGGNGTSVGTSIVVFGAGTVTTPTNGFTVTDAGGFGLAAVNGSNQVIRNTSTTLLPGTTATSNATDYRIDNNGGGSGADGSSSLAITASRSTKSITVDTTTASGNLTLNSAVVLSNSVWNFGAAGGNNTYQITGSASGAGVRTTNTGETLVINNFNAGTVTFNSPILAFGTNALIVGGNGTVVLNGLNTFTGATTINSGNLQIGSSGRLVGGTYAGAIAINGGSVFQYSGSNAQTLSGAISGPGEITKDTNTTDLTLSGVNVYTGTTTVSSGRIIASAVTNLSSGATSLVQSGVGQFFLGGVTYTNPFNISGTGFLEPTDSQNNNSGAIRLAGSTLSNTITLSGNSRIAAFGTTTNTISGQITGGFGIDFYGFQNAASAAEVFVLSNTNNNYTGNTTIFNSNYNTTNLAGVSTTLRLGASNVIPDGASAGNVAFAINGTNNNATVILDLNGFSETINGLTVNAGTFATRITNSVAGASVLTIGANNTTSSFNGTITNTTGTLAITKIGNGTLTLTGNNSYGGGTSLAAGTLSFANGSLGSTGNITFTGNSAIQWNGSNTQDISSRLVMTNGVTSTFDTNGNTVNFASSIGNSSAGALTKVGTGTLIIGGTSSYSGATTINGGTLQLDGSTSASSTVAIGTAGALSGSGTVNGNATLTGSGVISKSAGTIAGTLGVTGGNWNGAGSVTGLVTSSSGTFTIGSGANLTANGNLSVTGGSIAAGDAASTITGNVSYTSGSNSTFVGVIAGSSKTLTLNNASAVLTLTGNNTYTGATTVTAGTLVVTGSLASSGVTNNTAMVFNSGSAQAYGNAIGGSGTLTKQGAGTLTLNGTNTYSGLTTVSGGTLAINGSIVSALQVDAGATIGGYGTVSGNATIQGIHSPGNSPGIQTFGSDLTYSGGNSTINWELVGNTTTNAANPNAIYDQIIVGGNLDFAGATALNIAFNTGNSTVAWSDTFWDTNQSWVLHTVTGTTTNSGNLSLNVTDWLDSGNSTFSSVRSGNSFQVAQSGSNILINYIAVPEPATMVLFGSAVALLGFRLARRRKQS